jgi:hypothetical protein
LRNCKFDRGVVPDRSLLKMFRRYSIIAERAGICNYFVEVAGGVFDDIATPQLPSG